MKPGRLALTIIQGATFRRRFRWMRGDPPRPVAFPPGSTARAQIRVDGRAVLTFDSDDIPDRDGPITFSGDGWIELVADAVVVSAAPSGSGAWSLEVQPAGEDRVVLLAGGVTVEAEVTR